MLQYVIYILHKYQALTWHDNSAFPSNIWTILIVSSLEEIEMEKDVQLHQMYRYIEIRACDEWQTELVAAGFLAVARDENVMRK